MCYMEVTLLPQNTLRIKGKQSAFFVNPASKQQAQVAVIIGSPEQEPLVDDETVIIAGSGEYEIGGVRMSGIHAGEDTVYSFTVDGVEVLLGTLAAFEKGQSKLKEHHVVIVLARSVREASFMTSFASRALLFYGEQSESVVNSFEKEDLQTLGKYQVTLEKLPEEMQIIRLA